MVLRIARNGAWLAIFILLITWVCRVIISAGFEVAMDAQFWHRDYLGNLLVALMCALLVQSLTRTMVLSGVIIVMFQMANALKLSILGTPASPDDFFNIQNVFFLTEGWRRLVLYVVAATPLLLAVSLIPWRRASAWAGIGCLSAVIVMSYSQSIPLRIFLDTHIGNSVWNQPANFRQRGLALHLTQEMIRTASKVEKPPTQAVVDDALQALDVFAATTRTLESRLQQAMDAAAPAPDRNVHVFVLESFFDPLALGPQWVPEDPLPQSFRALWAETDNTTTLSPVFGGYTANAEFEMLCGFPVTRNAVFFEGWFRQSSPCLPRLLSAMGYDTLASHPNVPGFWNRTNAYQLIGFDQYRSKAHFDMSDSIDTLLLDHSLYEQVFEHIAQSEHSGPIFNYMLTYHGHLPYPSNENYPDQIKAGRESKLLHGYLNQLWYKSRALMDRLEILRAEDPNSLIIIFGDHLPFLGPNYGVHTDAFDLPNDRSEFTGAQLEKLTSTPLIVIDGKRGPLNLGRVPLYRLPSLVMSLLGHDEHLPFDATRNPGTQSIRPVYAMNYTLADDEVTACTDDSTGAPVCDRSRNWLQNIRTLTNDIFTGDQFSLAR